MARRNTYHGSASPSDGAAFTLIVDTREQLPYAFDGICPTVRRALAAGDYSIVGHDLPTPGGGFVIERKSLNDLFGTVIGARERFVRELEKLRLYAYAAILVEGSLRDVLTYDSSLAYSRFLLSRGHEPTEENLRGVALSRARSVLNSLNTWQIEYGVRVLFVDRDRDLCRAQVFRLAERFWRMKHEKNEAPAA